MTQMRFFIVVAVMLLLSSAVYAVNDEPALVKPTGGIKLSGGAILTAVSEQTKSPDASDALRQKQWVKVSFRIDRNDGKGPITVATASHYIDARLRAQLQSPFIFMLGATEQDGNLVLVYLWYDLPHAIVVKSDRKGGFQAGVSDTRLVTRGVVPAMDDETTITFTGSIKDQSVKIACMRHNRTHVFALEKDSKTEGEYHWKMIEAPPPGRSAEDILREEERRQEVKDKNLG